MRPSPARPGKQTPKFAPQSVPGMFLGYSIQPGGRWTGDYVAMPLEPLRGTPLDDQSKACSIHRIKEVYQNKEEGYLFPLKVIHDKCTREADDDGLAELLDDHEVTEDEAGPEEAEVPAPEPVEEKPGVKQEVTGGNPVPPTKNVDEFGTRTYKGARGGQPTPLHPERRVARGLKEGAC